MNNSHICPEIHPDSDLRCWKRTGHGDLHLTVLPNVDKNIRTRPLVARWS